MATSQPTIVRIWRGRTRRDRADAYEAYNYEGGIKPLIENALGVQTLREDREHESEFVTISLGVPRGVGGARYRLSQRPSSHVLRAAANRRKLCNGRR